MKLGKEEKAHTFSMSTKDDPFRLSLPSMRHPKFSSSREDTQGSINEINVIPAADLGYELFSYPQFMA